MAHRLADEILWMIMAPCLSISDDDFESTDFWTFGANDHVSISSVLLVCKRWMRIATPLIYEFVILRSTGQTHSLADALKRNPHFGLHVKKIRLEGAYSRLHEVFKRCTNLHSLFFVLDDIRYSDNANSLCRSLAVINPTRVRLEDQERTDLVHDNANKRKIFIALCSSVPGWTKLRDFYFPYHQNLFNGMPAQITDLSRRSMLAKELKDSPSVEIVRARTPTEWDPTWSNLASNPRIQFYFDVDPGEDPEYVQFRSAMDGNSELKRAIHFGQKLSLPKPPATPAAPSQNPLFSPLAIASDLVWSRVFSYALFELHPDDAQLAVFMQRDLYKVVYPMFRQRTDISLVCRGWNRLMERIFLHAPFIASVERLEALAASLKSDSTIGAQIHVLSLDLDLSGKEIAWILPKYNTALCEVFRHLPRLRYLFNFRAGPISWDAFKALVATAGSTLFKILNLNVRPSCDEALAEIFSGLQSLEELEIHHFPAFRRRTGSILAEDYLATVKELTFSGATSSESEHFASLHFPVLRTVRFFKATLHELKFLRSCGKSILRLEVTIDPKLQGLQDVKVDLLFYCQSLKTLVLGGEILLCPKFIRSSVGNNTLEQIIVSALLADQYHEAGSISEMDKFFEKIDFARFPLLTKIQFLQYQWPIHHRDIEKEYLITKALEITQRTGVEIVDVSGKTFRPRVQRQRRNRP